MAARSEDLYVYEFPRAQRKPAPRFSRRQIQARRRAVAAVGTFVAFFSIFMLASGPEGSALASRSEAPKAVSIQPGQSLWDLAERYSVPGSDPRAYVDALIELNDIQGHPLIGQRLKLPR